MKVETCQSGGAEPHQNKLRWGYNPHCPHGSYAYVGYQIDTMQSFKCKARQTKYK